MTIKSMPNNANFDQGYERIFGKKETSECAHVWDGVVITTYPPQYVTRCRNCGLTAAQGEKDE